jgi:hypothetical protein
MWNFHHRLLVFTYGETSSAAPPRKGHTRALGWQRRGKCGAPVRQRQGTHPERSIASDDRRDRHLPRLSSRAAGCGISQGTHSVRQEGDHHGCRGQDNGQEVDVDGHHRDAGGAACGQRWVELCVGRTGVWRLPRRLPQRLPRRFPQRLPWVWRSTDCHRGRGWAVLGTLLGTVWLSLCLPVCLPASRRSAIHPAVCSTSSTGLLVLL